MIDKITNIFNFRQRKVESKNTSKERQTDGRSPWQHQEREESQESKKEQRETKVITLSELTEAVDQLNNDSYFRSKGFSFTLLTRELKVVVKDRRGNLIQTLTGERTLHLAEHGNDLDTDHKGGLLNISC